MINTLVNQPAFRTAERLDTLLTSYPGISGAVDAVFITGPFILGGYRRIKRDVGINILAVSSWTGMKKSASQELLDPGDSLGTRHHFRIFLRPCLDLNRIFSQIPWTNDYPYGQTQQICIFEFNTRRLISIIIKNL